MLPIETGILEVALDLRRSGVADFHGFGIAEALRQEHGTRALTAHGTLYKALARLESAGLLASRWEDPDLAEGRPRRRLYRLTPDGAATIERVVAERRLLPTADVKPSIA